MPFQAIAYETEGAIDGVSVAKKIGHPADHVYKTLVTTAGPGKRMCLSFRWRRSWI